MRRSTVGFTWCGRNGGTVGAGSRSARVNRHRLRPALLELEERRLLSTIVVNNPTDTPVAGQTDLRQAIGQANAAGGSDTIDFDSTVFATPRTISLKSGVLELSDSGQLTITGPTAGLTVSGSSSGVFQIDAGASAAFSGLTITGGLATEGGGVLNSGNLTLTNCALSNNTASEYGGGVYNNATLTLVNCTLSHNTAGSSYFGGGLYNNDTATLTGCTLSDNTAGEYGGGVYNNSNLNVTSSTFYGNSAGSAYYGGGLYNDDNASLVSCTFSGNAAKEGGGMYCYRSLDMWDTIVAGNTGSSGGPDVYGDVHSGGSGNPSGGHNLIGNTANSSGWGSSDLLNISSAGLSKPGFYGGPTQTLALLPGSPAIGKGTPMKGVTTDQRGFPLDSPVDIGAFQVQSDPLVVNTILGGLSVPSGNLSLSGAVDLADALPGAHTITFAPKVFATAQTIALTSGQLELSNTSGTQTITGPAAGVTIKAGELTRVFAVDANVAASLSGLTITGAMVDGQTGGALLNSGKLVLTNCSVTGNTVFDGGNGGGLANYGTATLINCTVSGNSAGKNGGGLANYGTATLTNCTVSGNTAGKNGGGLFAVAPITLTNCSVSGNTASQGGGLYVHGAATLTDCALSSNTSSESGGGVLINNGKSTAALTNCTLSGNTANGGGGVYNEGTVSLTSCTVADNSGGAKGGGGVFSAGATTLTNTIVAANKSGSGAASDIGGGITVSGTYNLIGTGGSGGLTNGVSGNIVGVANPGLASLAFYGGPTQTMALSPGSPAIGKGTPVTGVPTDQRGFPLDSPVDIGAFQVDSKPLVVNTIFEGSSVPKGALDLAAAVKLAALELGAHSITFDPTVFAKAQTIALSSGQLELSNTGGTQTITGPAPGVTINARAASRVFQIDGGVTASLSGLTITGGSADQGGGLLNSGTLTMTNCTISGNSASKGGGGLASFGALTLTSCTLTGNHADSGSGGGLASYGPATLTKCTVSSNGADTAGGIFSTGTLILTDCTVTGNGASQIGGILTTGTATLTSSSINDNFSNQTGGLSIAGTATLINCSISGNASEQGSGGGLANNGTLTLTNCTLDRNGSGLTGNGGALANYGKATLTNCTVSGNTAFENGFTPGNGGGVQNSRVGTVNFIDCTLSGNVAGQGGGLYNLGTVTLTNTIVAGNTNTSKVASDIGGPSKVTGTFNLIGTGGSGGLTNGTSGNIVGVSNPGLGSLGTYGGPTQTISLLPGSPAIGKGTTISGITTDGRGMTRGSVVDIGAYQYSLVVESNAGPVDTAPSQLSLAGAVSLANAFAGPVGITFDPAVFTGMQTITLTAGGLELDTHVPIWTITTPGLAPGATVTINGGSFRAIQVDKGVTADISGLTIESNLAASGAAVQDLGTANLTNCQFIYSGELTGHGAIEVSGGTLNASQSRIANWDVGITVSNNAIVMITHGTITGTRIGILVGASSSDNSSVTAQYNDLANNITAVSNKESRPVGATYNWWGSSSGPNTKGASQTVGNVVFSPWLGDARSLNLSTPDSLGFTSTAGNSYVVTPDPSGPNIRISLVGDRNAPWTVTPTGTVVFTGNGGGVTINGQPKTDVFTLTNTSVTFAAGDAFNGATIQFNGNIGREIDAKGKTNSFDVSGLTGAATLTAPIATGTVSTLVATKNAGYTLTNSSLKSTDGMSLILKGITTANLTANATSGSPTVIVDASAFTGVTNLTAGGSGKVVLYGGGSKGKASTLTLNNTATGNDIMIGGPGANTLTDDGTGRNILIGGSGPNKITGNGNDILLSGTTVYDANTAANLAALDAILAEWSSTDAYGLRISKISNGITVGPNTYGLNSTTVHSNRQSNTVSDGPVQSQFQNWFIVNSSDAVTQKDETVTIINT